MKCPYNHRSEISIEVWGQCSDAESEDNKETGYTFRKYTFDQQDCLQEECGAWHDGRCCYGVKK